jgi:hypothetical protein
MRRFWWLRVPAFLVAVATLSVHTETFSLVGVTLATGSVSGIRPVSELLSLSLISRMGIPLPLQPDR